MIYPANNSNETDSESPEAPNTPTTFPWLPIAAVVLIGLASLALWHWDEPLVAFFRDQERIHAWLAELGPLAPVVSVGLNVAQVVLAPVPGQVIGFANLFLPRLSSAFGLR